MLEISLEPTKRGLRLDLSGASDLPYSVTYLAVGPRSAFATGEVHGVLHGGHAEVHCEVSFPVLRAGITSAHFGNGVSARQQLSPKEFANPPSTPTHAIGHIHTSDGDANYPYPL
jgi:hypothetical protein